MLDAVIQNRPAYVDHYWEHGYAVVRGVFSSDEMATIQAETQRIYAEGLKHHATWRHQNLLYEILPESFVGQRYLLQAHWIPGSARCSSASGATRACWR